MIYQDFLALFQESCSKNGVKALQNAQIEAFYQFTTHLVTVNQTTNLTAIREVPDIIAKHYVDSLLASDLIPNNATVLDIGCGPGFPSIPLAIARPDLQITALDSTQKKICFVEKSVKELHLTNLKSVSARAEDRQTMQSLGKFDIVISRAVAKLNILCELALPYVKVGGMMIAMKGAKADEEIDGGRNAIKVLGGVLKRTENATLVTPNGQEDRSLIVIFKESNSPAIYPRPYATIKKKEL